MHSVIQLLVSPIWNIQPWPTWPTMCISSVEAQRCNTEPVKSCRSVVCFGVTTTQNQEQNLPRAVKWCWMLFDQRKRCCCCGCFSSSYSFCFRRYCRARTAKPLTYRFHSLSNLSSSILFPLVCIFTPLILKQTTSQTSRKQHINPPLTPS